MGSLWAKWDVVLLANKKQVYLLKRDGVWGYILIYTEQNLHRNASRFGLAVRH